MQTAAMDKLKHGCSLTAGGVALVCLLAAWPLGCVKISGDGNDAYTMRSQYRTDVSSVFVPMWTRGDDVYRRELEFRLTEAVIKRIEMDTPYKSTRKSRADTELPGEILLIEQRVLSFNPDTGNPNEFEIVMTLSFTWRDLRSGDILVEETDLQVASTYIADAPLSEDFFQGSQDMIEEASRLVVEYMEAEWGEEDAEADRSENDIQ